ncbi:right-handed parallel beta-helix repeat-containing protein [Sphingomonas oryzagri]
MKLQIAILGLSVLTLPRAAHAQDQNALYVSPKGSDSNSGTAPATPFQSPERAEAEIIKRGSGTVYLMGGVFNRKTPLQIVRGASSQRWTAYQGQYPVLDGLGQTPDAIRVTADNVMIDGLVIRNYVNNGIVVNDSADAKIDNNRISNIASTRWTQAGILILGRSPSASITRNGISHVGYAGIQAFTAPPDGNLANLVITSNEVDDACKTKDDCGAIYVGGRSPTSDGAVIRGNTIKGYGGPNLQKGFGIYLDDWASKAQVVGNIIGGSGTNPIFIHGGKGNIISGNTITVTPGQQALFVGGAAGDRDSNMSGNRFERNTVHGARNFNDLMKFSAPGRRRPSLNSNWWNDR